MGLKEELLAEYERIPPNWIAEIIDGQVQVQPRPAVKHSKACARLMTELNNYERQYNSPVKGWLFLFEQEIRLKDDILVPDVAGWAPSNPVDEEADVYVVKAPDWVCEVLSPSTRKTDRTFKMNIYAREGVSHVWLIDPSQKSLEAFALYQGEYSALSVFQHAELFSADPFRNMHIPLTSFWAKPLTKSR